MPKKRCLTYEGLAPEYWCDGCAWLGDPENGCWADAKAEKAVAKKHPCTGQRSEARPAAFPDELQPRARKPPIRLEQSPSHASKFDFQRWTKNATDVGEATTSLRPAASERVSRSLRLALKFEDFEGFPFIDGLENSLAGPIAQIALAEQLQQRRHVAAEHLLSSADPVLRHLLEMLRLKEDDISSFRAQIFAKDNKARVEHAITKARNVQRYPVAAQ